MNEIAFDTWFNAQHKNRSDSGFPEKSDNELHKIAQAGRIADQVLTWRNSWDEKHQVAFYAWTAAKDLDK